MVDATRVVAQLAEAHSRARTEDPSIVSWDGANATGLLRQLVAGKRLEVKVGMAGEQEPRGDRFVIGFDPQVQARITRNRLLLPFVATACSPADAACPDTVPFYVNVQRPACSSTQRVRWQPNSTRYHALALGACRAFAQRTPTSRWWLHDSRAKTFGELSRAHRNCFACQDQRRIRWRGRLLPALPIGELLRKLAGPIDLLDLDAQGADVAMLESVREVLPRVSRVKLECQEPDSGPGFLYRTAVPNRCSRAESFLQHAGFSRQQLRINNCGCEEYNLFMARPASERRAGGSDLLTFP